MSAEASSQEARKEIKKSYGSTLVLFMLGVLAFYAGTNWLLLLIPAAILVWYAASGTHAQRNRN
jgi:hypothetical protein